MGYPHKPLPERFWAKVNRRGPDECWLWLGYCESGYGRIAVSGKSDRAHRVAWRLANGPIPAGRLVCHTCDNPPCVNPSHLWLGTVADNNHDMARKRRAVGPNADRTHCPSGHEYSPENTYLWRGSRRCRTCRRAHALRYNTQRRAA